MFYFITSLSLSLSLSDFDLSPFFIVLFSWFSLFTRPLSISLYTISLIFFTFAFDVSCHSLTFSRSLCVLVALTASHLSLSDLLSLLLALTHSSISFPSSPCPHCPLILFPLLLDARSLLSLLTHSLTLITLRSLTLSHSRISVLSSSSSSSVLLFPFARCSLSLRSLPVFILLIISFPSPYPPLHSHFLPWDNQWMSIAFVIVSPYSSLCHCFKRELEEVPAKGESRIVKSIYPGIYIYMNAFIIVIIIIIVF